MSVRLDTVKKGEVVKEVKTLNRYRRPMEFANGEIPYIECPRCHKETPLNSLPKEQYVLNEAENSLTMETTVTRHICRTPNCEKRIYSETGARDGVPFLNLFYKRRRRFLRLWLERVELPDPILKKSTRRQLPD